MVSLGGFISAPGEQRPEADCFVYSRVPPVDRIEPGPRGKNAPPLLTRQFAGLNAVRPSVPKDAVQLHFSDDGESVAIWLDGAVDIHRTRRAARVQQKHCVPIFRSALA